MTEDVTEVFAVVAEWKNQGPTLMEAEGAGTSYEKAREQMDKILGRQNALRACVVRLEYRFGNALLLHDMKRMQE